MEWTPPWWHRHPIAAPFNVLFMAALELGVLALIGHFARSVTMLRSLVVLFGLVAAAGMAATWGAFLRWMFGRVRFRVAEATFEHEVAVGPWRSRPLRVPLVRLLEIDARRKIHEVDGTEVPSQEIRITVRTATATHALETYGKGKERAVADVVAALPERLRRLGREVTLTGKLAGGSPRSLERPETVGAIPG